MNKIGRGRALLFSLITSVLTLIAILLAGETMVRLSVPEETFWPVSNIYWPSEVPGLVYTYRPNFRGAAFGVDLETNSFGFRGREWTKEKKPDTFRVALIGDSIAVGFGVPSRNVVSEVLSDLLEERYGIYTEVLNFGVNGYNSFQQVAALEHIALDFSPDLVILLPANNDHLPSMQADGKGWLHWDSDRTNQRSRIVDESIDKISVDEVTWWMEKSRLYLYLRLVGKRLQFSAQAQVQRQSSENHSSAVGSYWNEDAPSGPISENLKETVYVPFVEMLDKIEARGLPVIVASYCGGLDYRQMFQILEQERGVTVLELFRLFPETKSYQDLIQQFGLGWDNHLNSIAHHRWAVALEALIAEKDLGFGNHPNENLR